MELRISVTSDGSSRFYQVKGEVIEVKSEESGTLRHGRLGGKTLRIRYNALDPNVTYLEGTRYLLGMIKTYL